LKLQARVGRDRVSREQRTTLAGVVLGS